ncbi:alpha/beta-hydrolase [Eremomyces bilateralis CBS 781.70]|uniref:Alpha/beta-hydrolase n=1 Tax=Eremomyces bilateralis CBS 781.70 TaxID=1392243 RepID=A0A6G1FQE7_9PEZI|nr:alpha/beta-hydrolase [Eremomyces bilateralis CBS 781.70]KAF1808055.1 alpha/beta-hydrolase [Eremomyces bilateralis CBS 781.70]
MSARTETQFRNGSVNTGQELSRQELQSEYEIQASRLAKHAPTRHPSSRAIKAKFVTPQDPVVQTADAERLTAVPIPEAAKLNVLKDVLESHPPGQSLPSDPSTRIAKDGTIHGIGEMNSNGSDNIEDRLGVDGPFCEAQSQPTTNPLFPPLPMYGPPSLLRGLQSLTFRVTSMILSMCFLMVIVLGSILSGSSKVPGYFRARMKGDPKKSRPFYEEEKRRADERRYQQEEWLQEHGGRTVKDEERNAAAPTIPVPESLGVEETFVPTAGGPDPLTPHFRQYALREGLDLEEYTLETEDGFLISMWHLYNPHNYSPNPQADRGPLGPDNLFSISSGTGPSFPLGVGKSKAKGKYPVLLIPGLLQSPGSYLVSGPSSLAFFLAKSHYDIWLGAPRCGLNPRHTTLPSNDPRFWSWNLRAMGVFDLAALISRVVRETGFSKVALVAHSQGTAASMVALAKKQRPVIGERISLFAGLAPAAYAGPLLRRVYFRFIKMLPPQVFRMVFGIHAFIPAMLTFQKLLPSAIYGRLGYKVFTYLFEWTDERWERDLVPRYFLQSPVYISAESMAWWLGSMGFARQQCILATKREVRMEDDEDHRAPEENRAQPVHAPGSEEERAAYAWYDSRAPPFALWVAGSDNLVDGQRLLRRFERGREPCVNLVHSTVIEGYEHLDVLWAVDVIEKVGKELREWIWKTIPNEDRDRVVSVAGCKGIAPWESSSTH